MNSQLIKARTIKNDEYYTLLSDIEDELQHYSDFFSGKVVYCNCDNPYKSQFFQFFINNFNAYGIKQLICSCWNGEESSKLKLFEFSEQSDKKAILAIVNRVTANSVTQTLDDPDNTVLNMTGTGSYDSKECLEYLNMADVVVTNPPFSKYTEYLTYLMKHEKKFILVSPKFAVIYRSFFSYFKENKISIGYKRMNTDMYFTVPDSSTSYDRIVNGLKQKKLMACWFTNLPVDRHYNKYSFKNTYSPAEYLSYSNYDAIEVPSIYDIPDNYYGLMGVPLTFFDVYNPDQFEVIDVSPHFLYTQLTNQVDKQLKIQGTPDPYARIIIRRKHDAADI